MKWIKKDSSVIFFVIGLLMCVYPILSNFIVNNFQSNIINTYETTTKKISVERINKELKLANYYNQSLINSTMKSNNSYENILNINGDEVIGSLEIPSININVPIFHGTEDDKLNIGAGHLEGTSLPVGGKNTNSVITGHRGLPTSKLFTRLDELKNGDFFYINILNDTLAYEVKELRVVSPEDIDSIKIMKDKDIVTLVTCTPYGLNTKRLLVIGERTEYDQNKKENIKKKITSTREVIFYLVPLLSFGLGIFIFSSKRKGVRSDE